MLMSKLKIYIVAHKPCEIPCDEVMKPIHVGRAISQWKEEMSWMIGDDTGDNISVRNPYYCEMTAHYWIWKNVKDTEYVGVCHYRRFFGININNQNVKDLMAGYDVMLVEKAWYIDSVYAYFCKYIGAENMTILWTVMKRQCPEYVNILEEVCDGVQFHPFNMLLCRKNLFDKYCEWLFSILEECGHIVKQSPYSNARRTLAYMAELLTGLYFQYHGMKIKSIPYYKIENGQQLLVRRTHEEEMMLARYESLLKGTLSEKVRIDRYEKFVNSAILLGLKNDGILF